MAEQEQINILDIDHVFSILQHLYTNRGSPVLATSLRDVMPNYGRMMVIVRQLQSHGLVELKIETRPRKRCLICLTPKGRAVVRRLMVLDRMIRND